MTTVPLDRRWLVLVGVALLAMLGLLLGGGALALFRWYVPHEMPGARLTADNSRFWLTTSPALRRDTSYQSDAPFNEVYKWYSINFQLGPEQYGNGGCIVMARSSTVLRVFESDVGATVCDTPFGQTILLSRTLTLRWR